MASLDYKSLIGGLAIGVFIGTFSKTTFFANRNENFSANFSAATTEAQAATVDNITRNKLSPSGPKQQSSESEKHSSVTLIQESTAAEFTEETECKKVLSYLETYTTDYARSQTLSYVKHANISAEQEAQLTDLFKKEENLRILNPSSAEYEAQHALLPTVDDILGPEALKRYNDHMEHTSNHNTAQTTESDVEFIAKSLNLDKSKIEELRRALNSPDRLTEGNFLLLSRELDLSEEQEELLRPIYSEQMQNGIALEEGEAEENQLTDYSDILKKQQERLVAKAADYLRPEQIKRLEQLHKEELDLQY